MIEKIYQIFYDKLPDSLEDIIPVYEGCKLVTFLTPYYMSKMNESYYSLYEDFDYIASDGSYPLKINRWMGKPKSIRLSFDMSSMAPVVFDDVIKNNKAIYILGAKPEEIKRSVQTIRGFFPKLNICGFHHGYINDYKDTIVNEIIGSGANVCIIGMGAPLQDEMAVRLKTAGFVGSIYTCGGFIHQTTEGIHSFPEWTNKLNVRFVYRWFHEKGVFSRTPRQIWACLQYAWWLKSINIKGCKTDNDLRINK